MPDHVCKPCTNFFMFKQLFSVYFSRFPSLKTTYVVIFLFALLDMLFI